MFQPGVSGNPAGYNGKLPGKYESIDLDGLTTESIGLRDNISRDLSTASSLIDNDLSIFPSWQDEQETQHNLSYRTEHDADNKDISGKPE